MITGIDFFCQFRLKFFETKERPNKGQQGVRALENLLGTFLNVRSPDVRRKDVTAYISSVVAGCHEYAYYQFQSDILNFLEERKHITVVDAGSFVHQWSAAVEDRH